MSVTYPHKGGARLSAELLLNNSRSGTQTNELRLVKKKNPSKEGATSTKTTRIQEGLAAAAEDRKKQRRVGWGGFFRYAALVESRNVEALVCFNTQTCRRCLWSAGCTNKQLREVEALLKASNLHASIP